ncbi:sugar transferase [Methylobacterium durans]|uniref:sugar transferase n=1 Tax=Methylobacterium durans TaxID=2202825 RepID=UPI002AFEB2C1|nr:sugar transferase [Methylobacterium durans]MEA1832113.1 sugar transferase [Methylobacterium durans]
MSAHPPIVVGSEFQQAESARGPRSVAQTGRLDGWLKRSFDLTAAASALLLLLPIFILIALLVRAYDGGPALYRHRRVGRGQSSFDCLKFRTMRTDSQEALRLYLSGNPAALEEWAQTHKLKEDPRITPVGAILRKTSLDELPQLINILRGEMSVVGPRPIIEAEIEKYGPDAPAYFAVRPGLTGAWQVSGRSDTSYAERVRLDRLYVESRSFRGDLVIVLRTIPAVFFTRGSY